MTFIQAGIIIITITNFIVKIRDLKSRYSNLWSHNKITDWFSSGGHASLRWSSTPTDHISESCEMYKLLPNQTIQSRIVLNEIPIFIRSSMIWFSITCWSQILTMARNLHYSVVSFACISTMIVSSIIKLSAPRNITQLISDTTVYQLLGFLSVIDISIEPEWWSYYKVVDPDFSPVLCFSSSVQAGTHNWQRVWINDCEICNVLIIYLRFNFKTKCEHKLTLASEKVAYGKNKTDNYQQRNYLRNKMKLPHSMYNII